MEGPEAFAQDWNDTVQRGGTRHEVADRWGISPQVASNRALIVLPKLGLTMLDFGAQRGNANRAPRPANQFKGPLTPSQVQELMARHGGDMNAAGAEVGLTYQQFYKIVRDLKEMFKDDPDFQIVTKPRGRQKLKDAPSDEEFREMWNAAESTREAVETIKAKYPKLSVDYIKQMMYRLKRAHADEEDYLVKHLDSRTVSAKNRITYVPSENPNDDNVDDIFMGGDAPVAPEVEADEDVPNEESNEEDAEQLDIDAIFAAAGMGEEETSSEEVAPADQEEEEFIQAWNSSAYKSEALKKLKKLGWSPEGANEKWKELKLRGKKLKKLL